PILRRRVSVSCPLRAGSALADLLLLAGALRLLLTRQHELGCGLLLAVDRVAGRPHAEHVGCLVVARRLRDGVRRSLVNALVGHQIPLVSAHAVALPLKRPLTLGL